MQNLLILYLFLLSCSQTRLFRTACTQAPFSRCALTTHDAASSLGVTLESHSLWSCGPYSSRLCWRRRRLVSKLAAPTTRSVYVTLSVRAKVRRFCSRAGRSSLSWKLPVSIGRSRYSTSSVIFLITHVYVFFFFIFAAAVCVVYFLFFSRNVGKPTLCVECCWCCCCYCCWSVFFTPLVWCALFSQCCFLLFVPLSCSFKADRFSIKKGAFFTHCWFCESCCIFSPLSFALLIILCCVFLFTSSYFFILLSFFSSVRQVW